VTSRRDPAASARLAIGTTCVGSIRYRTGNTRPAAVDRLARVMERDMFTGWPHPHSFSAPASWGCPPPGRWPGRVMRCHRLIRHAYGDQRGYMRMVDPAFAAWDLLWAELGERLIVTTGVLALAQGESVWLAASRDAMAAHALAPTRIDPATVTARYPMLRVDGVSTCFHVSAGGTA
jgi:hypothetical protein